MAVHAVVTDESFDITLSGLDRVWALKRHVSVPLDVIAAADVVPRADAVRRVRWRLGGTYWPRAVFAGHYTVRDQPGTRAFASVYRAPEVLLVTTTVDRPRLVLLQHPDCHELAWYIGERIS